MGEHGARDDVPDGKDVAGGRLGLEVLVHDDAAALIQLHADRVQAQSVSQERPSACMQPCNISHARGNQQSCGEQGPAVGRALHFSQWGAQ